MDQLYAAIDIANAYEEFVSERADDRYREIAANEILQHFRATTDAQHLEANEQLQYIIRPLSTQKRLPHLTYAKNVQTIVQDLLGIMNTFGECVSTTFTDHSDIANTAKTFFKAKENDIAFMLDDDLDLGKGVCDVRTIASDTLIPKSPNTIDAIIVPVAEDIVHIESTDVSFVLSPDGQNSCKGIRKDTSRFDTHRAQCYGNVFLAKSLNEKLASVSLKTFSFRLPRSHKNESGTTVKASSFDCYVVGTSKITTFTKCMLEEVPCILVEGNTVTMYKPRFMYERDTADLVRFIKIVDGYVKSEGSMKSAIDSLYATLSIKNNRNKIEAAILSDTLNALRNKLQFVFEHLDVRDILTEYLPMTDKNIASILDGGNVPTEILQGFNNSNVRFLAALMDKLAMAPAKSSKESKSPSPQYAYVADVLTNPKYLQHEMPRKIDWCTDIKYSKSIVSSNVAELFSLFGMSVRPFDTIRKYDGTDAAIYNAHAYHKLILEVSVELDLADHKITDLEIFEGEYKAKHEEYFPIWNDLEYFVQCTPLNDLASDSIISLKMPNKNHVLKRAHEIAKRYPVVASSHYLQEVSSIVEILSNNPAMTKEFAENLSIANLDFEGLASTNSAATFRADVLVENAVNAMIESCMTRQDSLSDLSALADKLLVETKENENDERLVACVSLRNFMRSNSKCMGDMQDRLAMLVHSGRLVPSQTGGGGNATEPTVRDKLNAYVVKLMNSKTDVILQAAVVVFIFVVSNGVYKYYEGEEADTTTKELMKQIILNTLVMGVLANLAEHLEVELCIYAMYFAYVGMAVLRLVKTS
jgi:hypothetical protein